MPDAKPTDDADGGGDAEMKAFLETSRADADAGRMVPAVEFLMSLGRLVDRE